MQLNETPRALCGGSWINLAVNSRTAFRVGDYPDYRNYYSGFRVARPSKEPKKNPTNRRRLCGGYWHSLAIAVRPAHRTWCSSAFTLNGVGFRVIKPVKETKNKLTNRRRLRGCSRLTAGSYTRVAVHTQANPANTLISIGFRIMKPAKGDKMKLYKVFLKGDRSDRFVIADSIASAEQVYKTQFDAHCTIKSIELCAEHVYIQGAEVQK